MPRLLRAKASRFSAVLVFSTLGLAVGCQTNSMMTMPWNQPSRVPPPSAPTNLPTAPYTNPINPAAPESVSSYSNSPLTDAVSSAQNDLRLATERARSAIEDSANSVNNTVSQAGARLDRVGSGVVQATGIIESSLMDPIPMPPVTGSSGSISDVPAADPNSQWRKPVPR